MKNNMTKLIIMVALSMSILMLFGMPVSASTSNNWAWPTKSQTIKNDWPKYSSGAYHSGTDFPVSLNTPVYSTCDGTVVAVTSLTTSYGKHIKIKADVNGSTVYMRYCHLNSFSVSNGEKVKAGQLIGYSGSTGNSTGPHLHYEVRNSNDYYGNASSPTLNPRNYLPGSSYVFTTFNNDPVGCLDSCSGGEGVINISGWASDADEPDAGLKVHVYIGGPAGSSEAEGHLGIYANQYRSDVGNHGFYTTIQTDKVGTQEVYVYAINVGEGVNMLIGSGTVTIINSKNPIGRLDACSGGEGVVNIDGWARDADQPDIGLEIHVYIGGPAGSAEAEGHLGYYANQYRGDVGNHRFCATIRTDKVGTQKVYVYAINVGEGINTLIGSGTVTITKNKNPIGRLDACSGGEGVVNIDGWASDADQPEAGLEIHVYIGGPAGSSEAEGHLGIYANQYRSDVGNHGFHTTIRTDKVGTQELYVYAINVGEGVNTLIGFGTVTITENPKKSIEDCTIILSDNTYVYDGTAKMPSVTVKYGENILEENTDYTLSYSDNINAGTATVTITGIENYKGEITRSFTINKANQDINIDVFTLELKEGMTAQIEASSQGVLEFISNNTDIATVSPSGLVTGKANGSTVITATAAENNNYYSASTSIPVTVAHDYDDGVITTEATCIEDGTQTYTCNACGKTYTEVVKAVGHNYEEGIVEPTCTERGYTIHSCSVCGDHYRDQYVDALRHTFDDGVITTPATDEAEGSKTYTCSRCGEKKTEIIPAITHTYDDGEIIQAATCTEPGVMLYKCTDCDKTYTVEIPALGHQYETTITDATCVKKGYTTHTCTDCGDTYRDAYTNMKEHSYNSGEVIEEPACTEEGLKIYTCTVCNNQYTERIAEKGHQYETTVTPPTCTKKGYTTHTCSICKNSYRDTYTKEAEHSYNEGEIIEESTCVKEGMKVYTCDVCRNQYTEIISANGHLYEETVTAPDCTQKGYTTHKCSVCGNSYKDTYTDAKGHTWDAGDVSIEPGCETTGTKIYKCTVCNASRTEEVPPLGHEIVVDEAKAANCLESGFTDGIHCSRCGAVFKAQEEISAAGHHFSEWMIKEKATCTEKGKKERICSICGKKETEVIKESGHDWNDGVITQKATEQANGVKTYNCKICGEVKTETIPAIKKDPASDDKPKPSTLAVGTIVSDANSGGYYKITSSATVEYQESINEYASNIKIPDVVVINGVSYQVTAIAPGAFKNNKKIVSISMGSNIKSIGDNAFSGCSRLQKVTIGKGVRTIGAKAFYKCKSLTKITIPAKVVEIGKQAFYGCRKLKGITIKTKKLTAQNVGSKAFKGIHREAGIKVPKTKLKVYKKLVKAKGAGKKVKIKK